MKVWQLREMTNDELVHRIRELEEEAFNLRMQRAIKELSNPKRFREIKKEIARIKTILNERKLGIDKSFQRTEK
ncbi:50S ribosomal protein L29 [bacterium]|nr:50S ribosomal protein L29 [bacterium]